MKKNKIILLIIIGLLCILVKNNIVKADEACTVEVAQQLAKITFHENGFGNFVGDEDEYFFVELVTAGVVFNNANIKNGDGWYEKFYNLTNGNYAGYSKYKNKSFNDDVPLNRQGELLYIAELILTGKFNLPKNLRGQSSCACLLGTNACEGVNTELRAYDCQGAVGWGKEWTHVNSARSTLFAPYFGYPKNEILANVDIFGNSLSNTSPSYYKALAKKLRTNDYSKYNSKTVCNGLSNSVDIEIDEEEIDNNNDQTDKREEIIIVDACKNPDILRLIYFTDIIIGIIKIVVPIGLIIMGTIDFSKTIGTNDEEIQKKVVKIFVKRILCAVVIFATPWIIEVLISFLGNITKDINVKECLENANKESIEKLEADIQNQINNNNNNDNNDNNDDNNSNNNNNYIIYIGDSRTVGMCNSVSLNSNENCTITKTGVGYSWLNGTDVKNNLNNIMKSHPTSYIVINMGTNSSLSSSVAKNYATLYNNFAKTYPNSKVVAISVTQVDYQKAKKSGMYANITLDDNSVNNFNTTLKKNLNSNVMYCDVYSKMENYNYVTQDGVHYNTDTYKFIYNSIQNCLK